MSYQIICDNFFDGSKFNTGLFSIKIRNDKILKIEKIKKITAPVNGSEKIFDLRGKIITPGIIDSHNHFTFTALKMKYEYDLSTVTSISEIISIMKNRNKSHARWLLGYNLNEFNIKEKRMPNIKDLDEIDNGTPIFITHYSMHYAVCNSEALRTAKIGDETSNPYGGVIGRDERGNINGILYEPSAMNLVRSKIPEYSFSEYLEAISYASEKYLESGITCVKDIGGTGNDINEKTRIDALNKADRTGKLKIRVGVSLPIFSFNDAVEKMDLAGNIEESERLKFTGYKMFLDGSGLSRTAWMKEEWNKNYNEIDRNNYGFPVWELNEFKRTLEYISSTGATISIHAIGDRAISELLSIINSIKNKSKYAIVHCTSPSTEDLQNIKRNDITIESQGSFIYFFGNEYEANWGRLRKDRLFPFKEIVDMGINLCNGSDSPVTTYDPIYGIISTISREMQNSKYGEKKLNPNQGLTLEETLRTYTSNCAKVMNWNSIGILKKGNFADIIVWNSIPKNFQELSSMIPQTLSKFKDTSY